MVISEENFEQGVVLAKKLIERVLEYFENNEENEMIVEPYMTAGSALMQLGQVDEAYKYIIKAEQVVK
jgi:hypothetical protein